MKVLIAGASGLVGSALTPSLEREGAQVTRLVRSSAGAGEIEWHPNNDQIDASALEGFDAVINLAGENIAGGRWTDEVKRKIRDSRVNGTHLLSEAIAKLKQKPKAFLCASATGIYGDRGDEPLDEQSDSGGGFLAGVCREWEKSTEPALAAGVRTVNLRFGPIISREGGMLAKMLTPFKMGMGGKVGSGKQYISWVAIDDVVSAIKLASPRVRLSPLEASACRSTAGLVAAKFAGDMASHHCFTANCRRSLDLASSSTLSIPSTSSARNREASR